MRADGSEFYGEAAATPFTWNRQKAVIVGIVDLSDHQAIEQALRDSEKRYRTLLDIMPDGVRVNRDERIIYANQAEARLLGAASPEDLIGRVSTFTPPEQREHIMARRQMLLQNEIADWHETSRIRLDGKITSVEAAAVPINWDGEPAHLLVTRDISEKIDASPDAIRVHVDGVIVFANAAAAKLLGAENPDDLIGLRSSVFNHKDDHKKIDGFRDALEQGNNNHWWETRRVRLDGSVVEVEAAALTIDWDGKPGHLVINRDITRRREAEQLSTRLGRIVDASSNEV